MKEKIALTGIKPTGTPHIGNYLGMIRPALDLVEKYQALYFIADYHALTTVREGERLKEMSYDVAATFLALGLDPDEVVFFRQSDIPELFELTWILACFTAKGLLNRAHAYKATVAENEEAGRDPDAGINTGLYTYPVLMAADILLYGSHVVPVGQDQKQHVEIARDIATAFNSNYGDVLVVPEALIREEVATIPGVDGRKMSKNYDNVIPIFAPTKRLKKRVMRIVTDSRRPEDPKDPDRDNVFNIYKHFADPAATEAVRERYLQGGLAYSEIKEALFALLEETFAEPRERYDELMADPAHLEEVLLAGARKARAIGIPLMEEVRKSVGVRPKRQIELI
jgi:tryptophanyl-tRNA synthetase